MKKTYRGGCVCGSVRFERKTGLAGGRSIRHFSRARGGAGLFGRERLEGSGAFRPVIIAPAETRHP